MTTLKDFAKVMAYLAAAVQKPVSPETVEVYYDLLGDLPLEALQAGARRVVLEHPWATLPSVAELREAAARASTGKAAALTSAEAWELTWAAVKRIDPEIPHTVEKGLAVLPPLVARAVRAFGLNSLCYAGRPATPVAVLRKQFCEIFDQLADAEWRRALLPETLRVAIERQGPPGNNGAVAAAVQMIGNLPE